jgi:O-antigen/teichoic acid export membrane protein
MAGSGLLVNFYLAALVSQSALGVFNQIYAAYVIAAQVAAFGMHDSVQRHVARYHQDLLESRRAATAGLILAGIIGTCIAAVVFAGAPAVGTWTASVEVGAGISFAALGLPFFALNKVLFGALNGRRRMRAFAAGQAARAIGILSICVWIGENGYGFSFFGLCFSVTELLLFPVLATIVGWRGLYLGFDRVGAVQWWRRHFGFGLRGLPSGIMAEMFIRVDILMLGHFLDNAQVGKYSFAALFLEGLYQISVVIRTIVNPMLAQAETAGGRKIRLTIWRIAALAGGLTLFASLTLLAIYPHLTIFFAADLISESILPLKILLIGLIVYSVFVPFDYLLLQYGRPGTQSLMMGANVCANIALNAALIPHFGIIGAALATAASFIISALTLNSAVWLLLDMRGGILFIQKLPRIVE